MTQTLSTRSLTEAQIDAAKNTWLPEEAIKGLKLEQIDELKVRCALAKEASQVAGSAIIAAAQHLSAIKGIAKGKRWTAICEKGVLGMSQKNAEQLAIAYDLLLSKNQVPESCLANVSIRTLWMVAKENNEAKKAQAISRLTAAAGSGFTESEARQILRKPSATKAEKAPTVAELKAYIKELEEKLESVTNKKVSEVINNTKIYKKIHAVKN